MLRIIREVELIHSSDKERSQFTSNFTRSLSDCPIPLLIFLPKKSLYWRQRLCHKAVETNEEVLLFSSLKDSGGDTV